MALGNLTVCYYQEAACLPSRGSAVGEGEGAGEGEGMGVCVTGAGGYVASWLVKLLLSKGQKVHGTVQDPGTPFLLLSIKHLSMYHHTTIFGFYLFFSFHENESQVMKRTAI